MVFLFGLCRHPRCNATCVYSAPTQLPAACAVHFLRLSLPSSSTSDMLSEGSGADAPFRRCHDYLSSLLRPQKHSLLLSSSLEVN